MKVNMSDIFSIGTRVRVKESVIVFHHPEHRNNGYDINGLEGEVVGLLDHWSGQPVSANLPICVKFTPKFKAHLRQTELELLP